MVWAIYVTWTGPAFVDFSGVVWYSEWLRILTYLSKYDNKLDWQDGYILGLHVIFVILALLSKWNNKLDWKEMSTIERGRNSEMLE